LQYAGLRGAPLDVARILSREISLRSNKVNENKNLKVLKVAMRYHLLP